MKKIITLAALLTAISLHAAEKPRLNVLFLASDDMRPQLGCYGDKTVKSPNLDKLAARGRLFSRAFCQEALCSPSRISLLSGRHVWSTRIYNIGPELRSTMPDIVTLPQLFKNNGWHARSMGKIYHIGIDDPQSWSEKSFVTKVSRLGPIGAQKVKDARQKQQDEGIKDPDRGPGKAFYACPAFENPDCGDEELSDGDTAREAIQALRKFAGTPDKPFFLAVGFVNPHVPWVAPKKYFDLYDPAKLEIPANNFLPKNAPGFAATSGEDFYWYGNIPRDRKIDDNFGRDCLQGYLAAITYVDACVGRVVDELDRLGLSKNTVIVFWGDHGYYMGEHGWWGSKHNNYEGATNAPLIICPPGVNSPGKSTEGIAEFVDIYPTLAELAGLPVPEGVEGESLVPLLDNPGAAWDKAAFSEYYKKKNHGIAMRTDRYRYVEWRDNKNRLVACELYDHRKDPQENINIAGNPEVKELIRNLSARLASEVPGHLTEVKPAKKKE